MDIIKQASFTLEGVEIVDESVLFQGFFCMRNYSICHDLFAGGRSEVITRELLVKSQVAAALLYDPHLNKVVLLEQFRLGALADEHSPWLLELVAGMAEENESCEALIRREIKEEAGLEAQDLIPLFNYWTSPGCTNERLALYCAIIDAKKAGGIHGLAEEHEDILVHVLDTQEAISAVQSGRINNATTIIALQWLQLNKQKIDENLKQGISPAYGGDKVAGDSKGEL